MVLRVGVVGTGVISGIYFDNEKRFKDFTITACADLVPEAAQAAAQKWGLAAYSLDEMFAREDIDAILNLTIPAAHADVSRRAIESGKHVFSEKPLATDLASGAALIELAKAKGLRVGTAPDTVLGAGVQRTRTMIDAGDIGTPLSVVASVLSHGMEEWHPNPTFFFQPGGGPVMDMGPYYITTLITLLGPITRVMATGQVGFKERVCTAEGPKKGQSIPVNVLTNIHSVLQFESGAQATFLASWDVWKHGLSPIEIHGTDASLRVPDPNFFSGTIELGRDATEAWAETDTSDGVFGTPNWPTEKPVRANYRGLGLADMAAAIAENRPHRASGDLGLHTVAVLLGILEAAESGMPVEIGHRCERPAPLGEAEAKALLA